MLLYTVWSAVYFGYDIIDRYYNGVELLPLSTYIRKYFLNSSRIHLWYLIASVYAIPIVYLLWRFGRGALIAVCAVGCVMQCLDLPYHWSALYDIPQVIRFKEDFFVVYRTIFLAIPLMSLGVLCAKDYQKHTARQWLIRLILSCGVYVVEMIAVYIIKGQKMEAEILLSGPLVVYYLVNWQFTLDFSFPSKWVGEALRLSSTWIYCAHMLFLSLYRCIFAYQGIIRYVVVGGLTVVSGIIAKILVEKRKEQKRLGLRS